MDPSTQFSVLLGAGLGLLLAPTPNRRAPGLLRSVTKRPGLELTFDDRGRLASGPQVEQLLTRLVWRQTRALGAVLTGLALANLFAIEGPRLSQSTANSLLSAAVAVAGLAGAYVLQRPFLDPCAPSAGALRPAAGVEDYISPLRRSIVWLGAGSVLLIPVGAIVLAGTSTYDGSKFYWEGLVGLPVATILLVVATERRARGVRDSTADRGLGFFWDIVRQRALHNLFTLALLATTFCWALASAGVRGVALQGPASDWVSFTSTACRVLGLVFGIAGIGFIATPFNRFRRTLWAELAPEEKLIWDTRPSPAAS